MTEVSDIEIIDITPELAHHYLSKNKNNRRVRPRHVSALARDMVKGKWVWNGESIKFNKNDELVDGQHRLLAIIESNCTIKMLVIFGLEPSAQETVDTGPGRTFSDVLHFRGEKNAPILAAIVRKACLWEKIITSDRKFTPTHNQLLEFLDAYPWLRDVAREAAQMSRDCFLSGSVFGYCWFKFFQIDPDDCRAFFESLRTQENLTKGHPIYVLYHTLRREYMDAHSSRSDVWTTAIVIKAWNKFRKGETAGLYDYRPGGAHPEKAPIPQ